MKIRHLVQFDPRRVANPALPIDHIRNAYYNGIGRYVCQLQRITFKFCKTSYDSRGVREFIEKDLIDWSRNNAGVVVYLKPRRHKSAVCTTEYLNGMQHWMSLRYMAVNEIKWWLDILRTRSGYEFHQILSEQNTPFVSTQGVWNPFTNMPTELNISQFPNQERGEFKPEFPTATEQLLEIYKSYNQENESKTD